MKLIKFALLYISIFCSLTEVKTAFAMKYAVVMDNNTYVYGDAQLMQPIGRLKKGQIVHVSDHFTNYSRTALVAVSGYRGLVLGKNLQVLEDFDIENLERFPGRIDLPRENTLKSLVKAPMRFSPPMETLFNVDFGLSSASTGNGDVITTDHRGEYYSMSFEYWPFDQYGASVGFRRLDFVGKNSRYQEYGILTSINWGFLRYEHIKYVFSLQGDYSPSAKLAYENDVFKNAVMTGEILVKLEWRFQRGFGMNAGIGYISALGSQLANQAPNGGNSTYESIDGFKFTGYKLFIGLNYRPSYFY